jgi:hypothetical protein
LGVSSGKGLGSRASAQMKKELAGLASGSGKLGKKSI